MATAPSISNYSRGQGRLFVGPVGVDDAGLVAVGNTPSFSVEVSTTESEHYSSMAPNRVKDDVEVTETGGTVRFQTDEITGANLARALLGATAAFTQTAAEAATKAISAVEVGKAYEIGAVNLSEVSITDGAEVDPVAYVAGTHYTLYAEPGVVVILAKPDGAGADIEITYDSADVAADANREAVEILADADLRARLVFFSTNSKGRRVKIDIPQVWFKPSGAVEFISGGDYSTIDIEAEILYHDATPGHPMGKIEFLN